MRRMNGQRMWAASAALALGAAGCTDLTTLEDRRPMGDFQLGFNAVVADNAEMVPPSRSASAEDWEAALSEAVERRLGRYGGDRLYHLGIGVTGYALAVPGVPLIFSPRSTLVVEVTVWDDAAQAKLTEEPEELIIFEGMRPETLIGSGLLQDRDAQMRNLAYNAARKIETFLAANAEGWFGERAPADMPDPPDGEAPEIDITPLPPAGPADIPGPPPPRM